MIIDSVDAGVGAFIDLLKPTCNLLAVTLSGSIPAQMDITETLSGKVTSTRHTR
jgi:hypothetical protein